MNATPANNARAEALLGEPLRLTRLDVANQTGVPVDVNAARWRTMGFPEVATDAIAFTNADVELLSAMDQMFRVGKVDEAAREAILRTAGRTFSRLAEWQVRAMLQSLLKTDSGEPTDEQLKQLAEMLSLGSRAQDTLWRRHLAGAAMRLVHQFVDNPDSAPGCVGFVDIVGYTARSRSMSGTELAALVEDFESVASDLIAEHDGRVVKTIGDEVLFVVDDPLEAAWLGAELAEQHVHDRSFPNVRVGMAFGDLRHRLGDVLGPVVNMASRLTAVARPGRVLIDSAMAHRVEGSPGLRIRRMRKVHVKGFELVEPWSIKFDHDRQGGLRGVIDEVIDDARGEFAIRIQRRGR